MEQNFLDFIINTRNLEKYAVYLTRRIQDSDSLNFIFLGGSTFHCPLPDSVVCDQSSTEHHFKPTCVTFSFWEILWTERFFDASYFKPCRKWYVWFEKPLPIWKMCEIEWKNTVLVLNILQGFCVRYFIHYTRNKVT